MKGKNERCASLSCLFYSSMKNHSLEESEDLDEPTTDSTSFEAQVSTKKKGSNIDYNYNKTPVEDFKILMEQSSSLFIDIRICKQMSTLIILDWILVIHMMMHCLIKSHNV